MSRSSSCLVIVAALLLGGCYLSHERPEPSRDGGGVDAAAPDAGQDAGPVILPIGDECPPDYIHIAMGLVAAPSERDGLGSLAVSAHDDRELFREGHGGDHHFDLCVSDREAPLALSFLQEGGPNYILGVDADIAGESWGRFSQRALEWDQPRFLERVFLARQEPDSGFFLHVSSHGALEIDESPSMVPCNGILGPCRIRFIEVASSGSLLGGGAFSYRDFDHPMFETGEMTLDAHGSGLGDGRFEVRLPTTGLLADLPLTTVRPLDCSGPVGPATPGELDQWRCSYAGVASVDETVDGVARGGFEYVDGPTLHADTLMARLGSAEAGFEAYAFVPCCTASSSVEPLTFGEVDTLEGGGPLAEDVWFSVDAPGYRHAFAYTRESGNRDRFWVTREDGQAHIESDDLPPPFVERLEDRPPLEEMWVGATTTEDAPPWGAGPPVRMVRRRVIP